MSWSVQLSHSQGGTGVLDTGSRASGLHRCPASRRMLTKVAIDKRRKTKPRNQSLNQPPSAFCCFWALVRTVLPIEPRIFPASRQDGTSCHGQEADVLVFKSLHVNWLLSFSLWGTKPYLKVIFSEALSTPRCYFNIFESYLYIKRILPLCRQLYSKC